MRPLSASAPGMTKKELDLYTTTACELQELLHTKQYTSVDLVTLYLEQIEKHNHAGLGLHAIISTAPRALVIQEAETLDNERERVKIRSRAHGIPIIVKDSSCTGTLGMPTTSGTLALAGLSHETDAAYITKLRDAGCIVIAKANLSELGNFKGSNIMSGWSPVGGQTQSPYVRGGVNNRDRWLGHSAPGRSSSGSAVSVAAGFVPWSIGTETDGSVVCPSIRAALYSLKTTIGAMDMSGTQGASNKFFSAGGMAKCVTDLAILTEVLLLREIPLASASWNHIRLAALDPVKWRYPEDYCEPREDFFEQTDLEMNRAMDKINELGGKVLPNAPLRTPEEFFKERGRKSSRHLAIYQARVCMEGYFRLFDPPRLGRLEDLVSFIQEHSETELPSDNSNQDYLHEAVASSLTKEQFTRDLDLFRSKMREEVDGCLERCDADILVAPGDSNLAIMGMGAGYPIASAPLGFADFNGRPFGLLFLAKGGEEGKLLEAMAAWENTFSRGRQPPPMMRASGKEL